jgi:hypothetical protein
MWLIAKFKKNELMTLKNNLENKLESKITLYQPKFLTEFFKNNKKISREIPLIGNYVFIFHSKFSQKNLINFLSTTKGLEYFLGKSSINQIQINKFIELCKSFEDIKGNIKPTFFKNLLNYKAQFLSGPFVNKVFQVLEKNENYMRIILNDIEIKLSDKAKYLYRPL